MSDTNTINWYVTAGTLRAAFELATRDDGSEFWRLTSEARQTVDDLSSFVMDLHDDELPNDWRYQTIVSILDEIIESDKDADPSDLAWEIADSLTTIYTCELGAWLSENSGRLSYCDDANEEGLVPADASMFNRLQIGQFECIRSMADRIINKLGLSND